MCSMQMEFSGDNKLFLAEIAKLVKLSRNRRSLNKKISIVMQRDVQKHFADEQAPHSKWQGLKPITIFRKGSSRILQDKRRLLQSIRTDSNNNKAETGTNLKHKGFSYPKLHNFGGTKTPQREFMWLSQEAEDRIVNTVVDHWWRSRIPGVK